MNRRFSSPIDYDTPYSEYDIARVSALHRNWVRFQETYPYNAALLKILLGRSAKDAHMEMEVIPEEKARSIVQLLRKQATAAKSRRVDNLLPMGDS